jgi:hypothetical protein
MNGKFKTFQILKYIRFKKHKDAYSQLTYPLRYNGRDYMRLSSDAPVFLFRDFMALEYGGKWEKTDSASKCLDRFVKNVWRVIRTSGLLKQKETPQVPPAEYVRIMQKLFFMGTDACPNILKGPEYQNEGRKSIMGSEIPPVSVYNYEQIKGMNEAMKQRLAMEYLEFAKQMSKFSI